MCIRDRYALVAVLAAPLIWGARVWYRLACGFGIILAGYFALVSLLGEPRPLVIDLRPKEAPLIAAAPIPGEAIFLWVWLDDRPVNYRLPWSEETARRLHEARQRAEGEGGTVMIQPGRSDGGRPNIGYLPPPQPTGKPEGNTS